MNREWVAVGVMTKGARKVRTADLDAAGMKVLGPFPTADDARSAVNTLGMASFTHWVVVPLMAVTPQ